MSENQLLTVAVFALTGGCIWLAVTVWNLTRLIALVLQAISQQYSRTADE